MPSALISKVTSISTLPFARSPQAGQDELAEELVLLGALALALHDDDLHGRLVVAARREDLRAVGGHRRVLRDELLEVAALRHDPERVRRDVEQDHVLLVVDERGALDARAERDALVGVHALARLALEELLRRPAGSSACGSFRRRGRPPRCRPCRGERPTSVCRQMSIVRSMRSADRSSSVFAIDRALQVERLVATARDDERQVDLRLAHARELALGLLGGVLQALQGHAVLPQVDPVLLLEALDQPVDDPRVDVFAAEERVARGRDDLEDAARADLEDRDVERAAAEVVDGDRLLEVLAEAVRERRRGRLVDDADDVEARRSRPRPWWPGAGCR